MKVKHFISCLIFFLSFFIYIVSDFDLINIFRDYSSFESRKVYIKLHLRRFFFYHKHFNANTYMIKRMQLTPRPETESLYNILFPYFQPRWLDDLMRPPLPTSWSQWVSLKDILKLSSYYEE